MLRAFFLSILAIATCFAAGCFRMPVDSGPLIHDAYLWQRLWTPAVDAALPRAQGVFRRVIVLAGEIAWTRDEPATIPLEIDFAALKAAGVETGIALRIGMFSGPFAANDGRGNFIRDNVRGVLARFRTHGIQPAELQIDFDCPQKKLSGYRVWLGAIREAAGSVPVVITALPSWLAEPEFAGLAKQAGSYILQVHSASAPQLTPGDVTLCDPALAAKWVAAAGRIGVPFRVALPTYSSRLIFSGEGKLIDITSEVASPPPAGSQIRFARADPSALAGLLRKWTASRPRALRGVIWYRLPVASDRMNWQWATLQAVISGAPLGGKVSAAATGVNPCDITLRNEGNIDAAFPEKITVAWEAGNSLLAADALPGFEAAGKNDAIEFIGGSEISQERLPPGGRRTIGWLRLTTPGKIDVQISPSH